MIGLDSTQTNSFKLEVSYFEHETNSFMIVNFLILDNIVEVFQINSIVKNLM